MSGTRALSDDTVLERAIGVFWRNGYAGTSLRDLTPATGLNSAALCHRFTDKDRLLLETLRRYADEAPVERLTRLTPAADPLGTVFAIRLTARLGLDPKRQRAPADRAIACLRRPTQTRSKGHRR